MDKEIDEVQGENSIFSTTPKWAQKKKQLSRRKISGKGGPMSPDGPPGTLGLNGQPWEGSFVKGTKGKLKPKGGPVVKFELTEVREGPGFTDVGKMPLTKLIFRHTIAPQ